MGAHHNFVQRAEVFAVAVIGTLGNGTFDALVSFAVHNDSSFDLRFTVSMTSVKEIIIEIFDIFCFMW